LDKDTSGLMVVAKNDMAHQRLIHQFQTGRVTKEYEALVWGLPLRSQGRVESPIGRHPVQRKKMAVNAVHGKPALTEWQVLERFPQGITWMNLVLRTGRTHQIRVHLSSQGWPVVGDPLYGGKKNITSLQKEGRADIQNVISRQLLHARRLAFFHPTTYNYLDFSSPIPMDMENLIQSLRTGSGRSNHRVK
jgi:23S rRNA pseudouridine1911/1915/1917 synthase